MKEYEGGSSLADILHSELNASQEEHLHIRFFIVTLPTPIPRVERSSSALDRRFLSDLRVDATRQEEKLLVRELLPETQSNQTLDSSVHVEPTFDGSA